MRNLSSASEIDYVQPWFGVIIIASEYLYCLRLPYNSVIYAAGKFRETRTSAGVEAVLNIAVSLILVRQFGLVGVACGTFTAMTYRTVSFIRFLSKSVLELSVLEQVKRYAVSVLAYVTACLLLSRIPFTTTNYFQWGVYAAIVFICDTAITLMFNYLFMRKEMKIMFTKLLASRK